MARSREGFTIGTHTFQGEEQSWPDNEYRWMCSCGAKGRWHFETGYGWFAWLGHVMRKYHTNNWPLYHEARLLKEDR
jgi:hypothetical protein